MDWFLQQTKGCCMKIIKLLSMSRLKMFSYFDENQQLTRIEIRWQYSHKTGPNCEEKHAGHKSSPREQTQWDASKIYATDLSPLSPTLYLPVLGIRCQNNECKCAWTIFVHHRCCAESCQIGASRLGKLMLSGFFSLLRSQRKSSFARFRSNRPSHNQGCEICATAYYYY